MRVLVVMFCLVGSSAWAQTVLKSEPVALTPGQVALICDLKTGPFLARVFRIDSRLGGAKNDEGLEVFGRPEGVHSEARF